MSEDSTTKLAGVKMASKKFPCKNTSSLQPDHEPSLRRPIERSLVMLPVQRPHRWHQRMFRATVCLPKHRDLVLRTVVNSSCIRRHRDLVKQCTSVLKRCPMQLCIRSQLDQVRQYTVAIKGCSIPATSFPKHTLETLPQEILVEIFEHLNPFKALGLALASLAFSAVFKRTYPKIAHYFKEGYVIMGLSGLAQTFCMNGTYDINGISGDGKTMFVTPVAIANPAEREIEKKKRPKNRFQRWFRRCHL